jgi:hypothetical protein
MSKRNRSKQPVDLLQRLVDYRPETGEFFWKSRGHEDVHQPKDEEHRRAKTREHMAAVWNTAWAGKPAFTHARNGYRVGSVRRQILYAHRVAWAMHHGAWPPDDMEVDHINGDRGDNRIVNLRLVTPAQNSKNKRLQKINTSGYSGVHWVESRQRWEASISDGNRPIHLGSYFSKEEAVIARKAAEKVLGYHPRHGDPFRPAYEDPPRPGRARKPRVTCKSVT